MQPDKDELYEIQPYTAKELKDLLLQHGPLAKCDKASSCNDCHDCIRSEAIQRSIQTGL